MIVVLILDGESLIHLHLPQLTLRLGVEEVALRRILHWSSRLLHGRVHVVTAWAHCTHARLVHHIDLGRYLARSRADAVQGDEADLVLNVELIFMVLVKEHLQKRHMRVHSH